ncbi:MAG: alanine--tRNA ligase-related protein [Patescibacteria group bacterium]
MKITSKELRQKFLDFYESKRHAILPSASLVPKEDPTVLYNTAGMQPLIPYLTGQKHPLGVRLTNSQKCLRTDDIEEIGDNRHLSFFEMLGSWSLGEYFKKDSIEWGFEFLTSKDWLGLDPKRLFVTVYKGNQKNNVEPDYEAIDIWKNCFNSVGMIADAGIEYDFKKQIGEKYIYRITQKSGKDNWWGLPYRGPCGPSSEIYYLLDNQPLDFEESILPTLSNDDKEAWLDENVLEIWNHVFMEYTGEWGPSKEPMNLEPLENKNIDTGMGFERTLSVLNNFDTVYKTDSLSPIVEVINKYAKS